jgi:hypothetical protein
MYEQVGCNLGCLLTCVRKASVDLRFNVDVVRGNAGQVKIDKIKIEMLRSIEDNLKEYLGLNGVARLCMTTTKKNVKKGIVGAAVGVWAHRVIKEIRALTRLQRVGRVFIAKKVVQVLNIYTCVCVCAYRAFFTSLFYTDM